MNRYAALFFALVLSIFALVESAPGRCPRLPRSTTVSGAAGSAQGLKKFVDRFNAALGGDDNGSEKGPLRKGRRSINWDAAIVPFDMPGDFFKNNVTRGAEMKARGDEFRVSNPVRDVIDDKFSSINERASKNFITFSPERLFAPLKDNTVTVDFSVPGLNRDALVKGFGAVFVDVSRPRFTSATYLDRRGCVIAKKVVEPKHKGLSFLGVYFKKPIIAKVILELGNVPIGSGPNDGKADRVVLDDFLYGEPQPVWRG